MNTPEAELIGVSKGIFKIVLKLTQRIPHVFWQPLMVSNHVCAGKLFLKKQVAGGPVKNLTHQLLQFLKHGFPFPPKS